MRGRSILKQRILILLLIFTICVLLIFFAGCGRLCFYQTGKSIEQCERDLMECFYLACDIDLGMQKRGYEYLDADKLPHYTKLKQVRLVRSEEYMNSDNRRFEPEEYWVADGRCMASRLKEFQAQRGPLGSIIVTLVYEDETKR